MLGCFLFRTIFNINCRKLGSDFVPEISLISYKINQDFTHKILASMLIIINLFTIYAKAVTSKNIITLIEKQQRCAFDGKSLCTLLVLTASKSHSFLLSRSILICHLNAISIFAGVHCLWTNFVSFLLSCWMYIFYLPAQTEFWEKSIQISNISVLLPLYQNMNEWEWN